MSRKKCALSCRLEAAGSGTSFGFVDIPDELIEDGGCCFDLQRLVHTVLGANHAWRSCAKSSELLECGWACTEACHLRLFDEHNGPELTTLDAGDAGDACSGSGWWALTTAWSAWCQSLKKLSTTADGLQGHKVLSVCCYASVDIIKARLTTSWSLVQYPSWDNDKPVVLGLVRRDGHELQLADPALQDDFDVVATAVRQNGLSIQYASDRLKANAEIMLLAHPKWHKPVVSSIFRRYYASNREFALQALQKNASMFLCLHSDLQRDEKVALKAVQQDARTFNFLHEALCGDVGFVQQAILVNPRVCEHVARKQPSVCKHENIRRLMAEHGFALMLADWLPEDKEFDENIRRIMAEHGLALMLADWLPADKEFVLRQVKQNGLALRYADHWAEDHEIVLAAVTQNGLALRYARVLNSTVAAAAVSQNGLALSFCSHYRAYGDIVLKAVTQNGLALQYAYTPALAHANVLTTAILQNGHAFPALLMQLSCNYVRCDVDFSDLAVLAVRTKGVLKTLVGPFQLYRTQKVVFAAAQYNLSEISAVDQSDLPIPCLEAAFAEHVVASCLEADSCARTDTILSNAQRCWPSLRQRITWTWWVRLRRLRLEDINDVNSMSATST